MAGADDLASVAELLADPYARDILAAASETPVAAATLAERLDADPSTVYRRLEALEKHDLVVSRVQPRADGHHYSVYQTRLRRVTVELEDGEYELVVDREPPTDPADRLTDLFEEIR
jgi:DNA-binding transcriptional ArsR family regulator